MTAGVKKRVNKVSGLLPSIISGIWAEPRVLFISMTSNFGISSSDVMSVGSFLFLLCGLYWVGGTKSWSLERPLFIGREGMVNHGTLCS